MFCKKCGKNIKDNAVFCPYCGGQIKGNEVPLKTGGESGRLTTSFLTEEERGRTQTRHFASRLKEEDKKKLIAVICGGVILILLVCIVFLLIGKSPKGTIEEQENSVIGEWSSEDLSDLGAILRNKAGGWKGDVLEYTIGDALGEATITFSPNGYLYIGFYDVSIEIGEFTYELINESRMALAYKIEIPVLGNTLTLSHNASYKVNKDTMTLDFFGKEVTLDREEEKYE